MPSAGNRETNFDRVTAVSPFWAMKTHNEEGDGLDGAGAEQFRISE